jgi:hypothetical protein
MWLEGLGQLKNPMTSPGIEPATFWLVAQCLNQLRYRVLQSGYKHITSDMNRKPEFCSLPAS